MNVYGLDDFPAEYVQVLDGELNTEQWKAGTGVYVTPLRMMGDGSLYLYKPGDQISVTQLDGTEEYEYPFGGRTGKCYYEKTYSFN